MAVDFMESFVTALGPPMAGTGVAPEDLGLGDVAFVKQLHEAGLTGVYANGFISLCSLREKDAGLEAWRWLLPSGTRVFGCTAFCTVFLLTPNGKVGLLFPDDGSFAEIGHADFFLRTIGNDEDIRDETFMRPDYELFLQKHPDQKAIEQVLINTALMLEAPPQMAPRTLGSLGVHLTFAGQFFGGGE